MPIQNDYFSLETIKNTDTASFVATVTAKPESSGLLHGTKAAEVATQMLHIQKEALSQAPEHYAVHIVLNLHHLGVMNPIGNTAVLEPLKKLVELAKDYRVQVHICSIKPAAGSKKEGIVLSMNPIKWKIFAKLIQKLGLRHRLDISNLGFLLPEHFEKVQQDLLKV